MSRAPFGRTRRGELVERITLSNDDLEVSILTFGAVLHDVRMPGVSHGLTLGSHQLAAYEGPMATYGALIGPVANRISGASVCIADRRHDLEPNFLGKHSLHSGPNGLQSRVFKVTHHFADRLDLEIELAGGECGLPGNRRIAICYRLEGAAVSFQVTAQTDAPTLMNLANHSYWNLDGTPTYAGHSLSIAADAYLTTDDELIPTGQIKPVDGTPFDFRAGRTLCASRDEFFDHNFCLSRTRGPVRPVAKLTGRSGISLNIETTEPGLQFYDGGTMDSRGFAGYKGAPYGPYSAVALETQLWPDAPANPDFPPIDLLPGKAYRAKTIYRFDRN